MGAGAGAGAANAVQLTVNPNRLAVSGLRAGKTVLSRASSICMKSEDEKDKGARSQEQTRKAPAARLSNPILSYPIAGPAEQA